MKLPNGNITHRAWADWKFDAVVIIGNAARGGLCSALLPALTGGNYA